MKRTTNALGFCNIKLRNLATAGFITGLVVIVGSLILRDGSERWWIPAKEGGLESIQELERIVESGVTTD